MVIFTANYAIIYWYVDKLCPLDTESLYVIVPEVGPFI